MSITRERLIELARNESLQRAASGSVVSGYLIGSVAVGEPLLGDTADIDLVLIHEDGYPLQRESVRLSHQVHLDISHHSKVMYTKPSELRVHPWLGPNLCEPIFLYDPQHFFEWAQAGARGQFYRADHTKARASAFLKTARQGQTLLNLSDRWLRHYLRSVMDAANSVACLDRFPAAGRRVALEIALVAEQFEHPDLYLDFVQLLGGEQLSTWDIPQTLSDWARAYDVASQLDTQHGLPAYRRDYYLHGFQAMVEGDQADTIIWPLLQVWERVISALPDSDDNLSHFESWKAFLGRLGLGNRDKKRRSKMLHNYIDQQAVWIEDWARRTGA